MPHVNPDLHGNAPDHCPAVLLLVDVINDLEFPGAEALLRPALVMAKRLAALKERAARAGLPAIYVNDNFGHWRSDFRAQVRHCLHDGVRGQPLVERLAPAARDYFVLKPKHSGFYESPLDVLLRYMGARTLSVTGLTTERCVYFTANDAFLRDYRLFVPSDCTAAQDPAVKRRALAEMKKLLRADVRPSASLRLGDLARRRAPRGRGAR